LAEKSFTKTGYKFMKFLLFNEVAKELSAKVNAGTIIAILNPKSLKN
jgi:hypothetical protein